MRWIDQELQIDEVLTALEGARTLFIDTEFESARSGTTLSVIQVTAGEEIFLLDALRLKTLPRLSEVMLGPNVEWVLHAGFQDIELLLRCLEATAPPQLFDTQVAWALSSAEASVGLLYLQYRLLGVRSMKSHQSDDWMRRPLPAAQLEYAAADVIHLPAVTQKLRSRLKEHNKEEILPAVCLEVLAPKRAVASRLTLASFRNAWQLEVANQAALGFLIDWHNALPGRAKAHAPPAKTLFAIASRLPQNTADLGRIKGLAYGVVKAHGRALVDGVVRAAKQSTVADFEAIEPLPYATFEELVDEGWLSHLRASVSSKMNIAPELAFPSRLIKSWHEPIREHGRTCTPDLLTGWRKTLLREAVQHFVNASAELG